MRDGEDTAIEAVNFASSVLSRLGIKVEDMPNKGEHRRLKIRLVELFVNNLPEGPEFPHDFH